MAEVWRAEVVGAEGFRRPVAIKRILPQLTRSPEHRAMFVREARVAALLDHPNVVQTYDFGDDEDGLYLVMEWVDGLSLKELHQLLVVHDVLPSPALVAGMTIEVLRALEAAHENVHTGDEGEKTPAPILHRDVTPSNVLLSSRGVVKLTDFGLALAANRATLAGGTPLGMVKGKLSYLAPELVQGMGPSPASDLYGVGIMMWETLTARRAFGEGVEDDVVARALVNGERRPPVRSARRDVPASLAEIVDRAVAPSPDERFGSATEFARALSDALRAIPERTDQARLAREVTRAQDAVRQLRTHAPTVPGGIPTAVAAAAARSRPSISRPSFTSPESAIPLSGSELVPASQDRDSRGTALVGSTDERPSQEIMVSSQDTIPVSEERPSDQFEEAIPLMRPSQIPPAPKKG